jgi:ADP-ribosylglycohydrolase
MTASQPKLAPVATSRARGALVGAAVGDAAGFPALYHRSIRVGRRRRSLWRFAAELDRHQILRFPLPYTQGRPDGLQVCGTDDAEFLAVAALILLRSDGFGSGSLFTCWQQLMSEAGDALWCGIAERSALVNADRGLRPPQTGNDNPAHYDDGAVLRAVAAGVRFADDPDRAAEVARTLAQITHADDGVWAAEAMAATIAAAVGGAPLEPALEAGLARIPDESWLSRRMHAALRLAELASSPFDLAAELNDHVANASYGFGTVAPETLASAFAMARVAEGDPGLAIPAAATVTKQADSMPAMVGAISGAVAGVQRLPQAWATKVSTLRGICIPTLAGVSLVDLADELLAAGSGASQPPPSGVTTEE